MPQTVRRKSYCRSVTLDGITKLSGERVITAPWHWMVLSNRQEKELLPLLDTGMYLAMECNLPLSLMFIGAVQCGDRRFSLQLDGVLLGNVENMTC